MVCSTHNGYTVVHSINKDVLDLDKTFDCGQCFRWAKLADNTWQGVLDNKIFVIKQTQLNGEPVLITNASIQDWNNILYEYFDLGRKYRFDLDKSDLFAHRAMEFGKGIRILKQYPWEALISFIISQRNNIPKIKTTIKRMCEKLGEPIKTSIGSTTFTDYTFPSADKLINMESIQDLGLGYRDKYIVGAARLVHSGRLRLDILAMPHMTGTSTVEILKELDGVGDKVANCVALFGLNKLDTFPIDIWMQRVIDTYYNGSIDKTKYGSLAGLMQQYMFYYIKYGIN